MCGLSRGKEETYLLTAETFWPVMVSLQGQPRRAKPSGSGSPSLTLHSPLPLSGWHGCERDLHRAAEEVVGHVHMLCLLFKTKPYVTTPKDGLGGHWTPVFVPLPNMTTLNQSPFAFHQTSFFLSFFFFLPPSLAYWDECLNFCVFLFFFLFLKLLEPRLVP